MNRHLHIVCLDIPYPADYGGSIDMFQRIIALHRTGIKIHLHYFDYRNITDTKILSNYCESINSYERRSGLKGFSFRLPYIVASRNNKKLVENLNKDEYPVFLEGVHCSGIIRDIKKADRKIIVRLHNDESDYYKGLYHSEKDLFRKLYFLNESRLLKIYQHHLPADCLYLCVTDADLEKFKEIYHVSNIKKMPSFLGWQNVKSLEGKGSFCLYHGNLSICENEKAAIWLLDKVFRKIKLPFIIAGKNPSKSLDKIAHLCKHTCLVANPSEDEINDLIQKAHINILPSFNTTGLKLKLLHALFQGRHCVVNDAAVDGTGLAGACHIGNNANELAEIVSELYHTPFTKDDIDERKKMFCGSYNNARSAELLNQWLFGHYQ
ncbi:MAG: glycosyltransferase family 4 protein [Bacteroidota bacterium]